MQYLVLQCLWPLKITNESSCFAKRLETFKKGKREAMWHISGTCIEGESTIKWRISVIVSGEGTNIGHVALHAWMEESRREAMLSAWTGIAPLEQARGVALALLEDGRGPWGSHMGRDQLSHWSQFPATAVKCVCLPNICCTQQHIPRAFQPISEPYS